MSWSPARSRSPGAPPSSWITHASVRPISANRIAACSGSSSSATATSHAERQLEQWCAAREVALVILRAPGIYAVERLPLERLRSRVPVLRREDDVYTSHIHADDLAAAVARALEADAPAGVYNAADDTELLMGEWLDRVADHAGLPRPPRVSRSQIAALGPPEPPPFMQESRRRDHTR